ncbi:MAG TPA: Spy/CpxP family protein refolding chaperone [Holophagaceae bacterium]|nr:Spy/CpxP family protein refolding chaperone [Holophagaceae bacterium]
MRPLAFLLAAALPTFAPAGAQAPPPRPHGAMGDPMATALGLTPDQQAKMKAIREKYRDAGKADHEAARAQEQAFRAAMEDPKTSEAQLRETFDQMNARRFQGLLQRRAMRQEMRAVLTPDQQAKADAMRAEFKARMKTRMEQRMKDWKDRQPPQNP